MNIKLFLAFIYLSNNVIAWNIFKKSYNFKKLFIKNEDHHEDDNQKNKTHTFLDDEEFIYILRFYRPI
uniref:Uncharacterized protein n=1 Tax=Florenciella sp. virus SA2 TaxID=3240092 RepID=A0AB39JFA9_9VIRU